MSYHPWEAFIVNKAFKLIMVVFCFWEHLAAGEFLLHSLVKQVKAKQPENRLVRLRFSDFFCGVCKFWWSL